METCIFEGRVVDAADGTRVVGMLRRSWDAVVVNWGMLAVGLVTIGTTLIGRVSWKPIAAGMLFSAVAIAGLRKSADIGKAEVAETVTLFFNRLVDEHGQEKPKVPPPRETTEVELP